MSFKTEYGEAFMFNSMALYNIEYDNVKLNLIYKHLELLYDKNYRINHNRFFNDNELRVTFKLLENHIFKIKEIIEEDDELKDFVIELIDTIFNDMILIAEDFTLFEMCGNMKKLNVMIQDELKNKMVL